MSTDALDLAGIKAGLLLVPPACAALFFVARKVWRLNVLLVRALVDITGTEHVPSLRQEIESLRGQVRGIDKELHPNGGASLRDQIVRVETEIGAVKQMAADAKDAAADAASEAEGLSGAVARFHHDARVRADLAGRERRGVQETLETLLGSLADYAQEGHQKEQAYVRALKRLGIDLTDVTVEMEVEGSGGDG